MKMQQSPRIILIFLLSNLFLPNSLAQNPSQFSLPEDATTRFGKGSAYQIQYAPDGKHLAVAVPSVSGFTIPQPTKKWHYSQVIQKMSRV